MKICFIASSGGHWEEMMCLKDLILENDSFFVTEEGGQANDCNVENIYLVPQINRKESGFIKHFITLIFKMWKIFRKENPDVIITTGALIAVPMCYIGKIYRTKIIYIESFARVYEPSLTGKIIYPISDKFIVQWEELKKFYPKSVYVGGIF